MIMKLSLSMSLPVFKQKQPSFTIPTTNNQLNASPQLSKDKVVVVMGATGTGKTRLSIDLATCFAAEVINSDKMQVYKGLEITTNKATEEERRGVNHHLLSIADPESDFSPTNFCTMASLSLHTILSNDHLPIIVGGSNSFIEALVDDKFRLNYDCCFLWVDAASHVHHATLSDRVDKMVERGMVEEVREFYHPNIDYTKGIRQSIGVPEFDHFFRVESLSNEKTRHKIMVEAIDNIKMNTIKLARRQLDKIHRLRDIKGWNMHHLDSTEVLMRRGEYNDDVWEELVAGPAITTVKRFLHDSEASSFLRSDN